MHFNAIQSTNMDKWVKEPRVTLHCHKHLSLSQSEGDSVEISKEEQLKLHIHNLHVVVGLKSISFRIPVLEH